MLVPSSFSADLSVPAEFVMRLQPPGSNNDFLRPSDIFVDNNNGEVFVADPGKNRILIFDSSATFRYEFEGAEHFSTPLNIVVDSEGYIFVLGSTREGRRIKKFDFDGLFISDFVLPLTIDSLPVDYTCLTIDKNDNLYVYDRQELRICTFSTDGLLLNKFTLVPDEDEKFRQEIIINSLTIQNEKIYIPISNLGVIYIYDLAGNIQKGIGRRGNTVGQLNFPVEIKFTHDNLMMVLDKHRINVVCYSLDGTFLGEFGGKGSSPGWFYHPTLLETNNQNQVYVGQIFENKIQLCQIPQFILDKNNLANDTSSQSNAGVDNAL